MLFQADFGAMPPVPLYEYPRWSASLWDLVARAIALGLREHADCLDEEVPAVTSRRRRSAFADRICAFIEHRSVHKEARRTLATVEIEQFEKRRSTYVATFKEDTAGDREVKTTPFDFRPDRLRPAELLLHACLAKFGEKDRLPPRPLLYMPSVVEYAGKKYIQVDRLAEPARTGFNDWLFRSEALEAFKDQGSKGAEGEVGVAEPNAERESHGPCIGIYLHSVSI